MNLIKAAEKEIRLLINQDLKNYMFHTGGIPLESPFDNPSPTIIELEHVLNDFEEKYPAHGEEIHLFNHDGMTAAIPGPLNLIPNIFLDTRMPIGVMALVADEPRPMFYGYLDELEPLCLSPEEKIRAVVNKLASEGAIITIHNIE